MNKHNLRTAIAAAGAMLILILDGKTALAGAADGISICLNTLIPSLFPFFILSVLLTGALSGQDIPVLHPVAKLCHIPKGAESLLAIGMLGGYPVGAQNVSLAHRAGQLTDHQAARMIAFCNNAGPSFIFGILGYMFSSPITPWLLWGIHMTSALLVGMVLPDVPEDRSVTPLTKTIHLTDALAQSVRTMGLVCGWVVLLRMMLSFLQRWFLWMLPLPAEISISGILELANGCLQLSRLDCEGLRFILASAFLSLGGICITLQTASVADHIPMHFYFPGKFLQCAISILLSCFAQYVFPIPLRYSWGTIAAVSSVVLVGILLSLRYSQKSSSIPATIDV